jgi:predicted cupin superfamily sugar epimerase
MTTFKYWIEHLALQPHPEGGYYRESYRSDLLLENLPDSFPGKRNASTAIYFLLPSDQKSLFHKIKSDEIWHFHMGSPLHIYVLETKGFKRHTLGLSLEEGELPQVVIPANTWFGAIVAEANSYTLASCTVAPGFDFSDFEMAQREILLMEFPQHRDIVTLLTN